MNLNPNGHKYEYITIPASTIKIDKAYQRPLDDKRVRKIVSNFNGDIFNEPKLSFRDGNYWCFDGQQSRAAWQLLHNNPDEMITCKVFYGLTQNDEIDLFVLQNGLSADVASNCKLHARYYKGEQDVVEMVDIAHKYGYKVNWSGNGGLKGNIDAVKTVYDCYMNLGPKAFDNMMSVISAAWGNNPEAVQQKILTLLRKFYKIYWPEFDSHRLEKVLGDTTPKTIVKKHVQDRDVDKNAGVKEIVKLYNKGLYQNNRLEYKL